MWLVNLRQQSIIAVAMVFSSAIACAGDTGDQSSAVTEIDANTQSECEMVECDSTATPQISNETWFDKSHRHVSNQADDLAQWLDHFFGVRRSDLEAANSSLRLQIGYDWDEWDSESRVRVRGKLYLPRISKRVSLVFTDEDDEEGDNEDIESVARDVDRDNSVALEYNVKDDENSRLDFRLGLRDVAKIKAAVRYRYLYPFRETYLARFTEELYFQDGEGFGLVTKADLDRAIDTRQLVRWSNRFEYGEETDGVEWGTKLSLRRRVGNKAAASYFVFTNGDTRPQRNNSYGLGLSYRRNILREWLFFEVEPSYSWRRDELVGDREGVAGVDVRLEILLEETFAQYR